MWRNNQENEFVGSTPRPASTRQKRVALSHRCTLLSASNYGGCMKNFLAVYTGNTESFEKSGWSKLSEADRKAREATGMKAWGDWMEKHQASIVTIGGPLGKTKQVAKDGITDIRNELAGFVVVKAADHAAA